nr:hypothetical protein [Propionicimonas sp.]
MAQVLHPPPERFEPITARWLVPGGPVPDPERNAVDPGHSEPVTLVGRLPRELDGTVASGEPLGPWRARRAALLVFAVVALTAMVIMGGVAGLP